MASKLHIDSWFYRFREDTNGGLKQDICPVVYTFEHLSYALHTQAVFIQNTLIYEQYCSGMVPVMI